MEQSVQSMDPVKMIKETPNSSSGAVLGWDIPTWNLVRHHTLVLGYQNNKSKQNKLLVYAPQYFSKALWSFSLSLLRQLILRYNGYKALEVKATPCLASLR